MIEPFVGLALELVFAGSAPVEQIDGAPVWPDYYGAAGTVFFETEPKTE